MKLLRNVSLNINWSADFSIFKDVSVAFVTIPQMDYHNVVLDHSLLISDLSCNSNSMSLNFTTNEAFNAAQANWTLESFVVITSNLGCASTTGQHDYILVNDVFLSTQGLSATLATSYIDFTQAVGISNPVTVDLGNYTLSQGNGSTGFTTGPIGGANSTVRSTNSSTPSSPDFDVSLCVYPSLIQRTQLPCGVGSPKLVARLTYMRKGINLLASSMSMMILIGLNYTLV